MMSLSHSITVLAEAETVVAQSLDLSYFPMLQAAQLHYRPQPEAFSGTGESHSAPMLEAGWECPRINTT